MVSKFEDDFCRFTQIAAQNYEIYLWRCRLETVFVVFKVKVTKGHKYIYKCLMLIYSNFQALEQYGAKLDRVWLSAEFHCKQINSCLFVFFKSRRPKVISTFISA